MLQPMAREPDRCFHLKSTGKVLTSNSSHEESPVAQMLMIKKKMAKVMNKVMHQLLPDKVVSQVTVDINKVQVTDNNISADNTHTDSYFTNYSKKNL